MARLRELVFKPTRPVPCSVIALDGATKLEFAIRLLPAYDTRSAAEQARIYAKAHGSPDPKPDDVMYLRGLWANTLLLACVDPDAPHESPVPYFDSVEQIERLLDDARVAFVFQAWRDHQMEHAPTAEGLTPEQVVQLIAASADEWRAGGDPERPFGALPSPTLRSFSAQLALRYSALTEMLSQFGSRKPADTSTSSNTAESFADTGSSHESG